MGIYGMEVAKKRMKKNKEKLVFIPLSWSAGIEYYYEGRIMQLHTIDVELRMRAMPLDS